MEDEMKSEEWKKEERHLAKCISFIEKNIEEQSAEYTRTKAETKELYDNYRSNNPELHNDLVMGLERQRMLDQSLGKNERALKKPYFGRIDYVEHGEKNDFSLYIGKNGVMGEGAQIVVVDWRAPVSSVYYESDVGESYYMSPFSEKIHVKLNLKRTFEIENRKLVDFYDTDVIANDEFLTKYLAKSKEVVLGEIIATIQKEQNCIIRDTPWHSIIVQGVAGSGKTTVAMHRISYLLYNYKERLRPDEFYIIGSNKMLLNYITGVLPNLDVYNVNQMTMVEFFEELLDRDFDYHKKKYTYVDTFSPESNTKGTETLNYKIMISEMKRWKGSIAFVQGFEAFLNRYEEQTIVKKKISYRDKVMFMEEDLKIFLTTFPELPLYEKIDMLNKRLASKIRSFGEELEYEPEVIRAEQKKYKNHFGKKNDKSNLMLIYQEYLTSLQLEQEWYLDQGIPLPSKEAVELLQQVLDGKKVDLYDLGMLTYAKRRIRITDDFSFVSHIVIDEAQDFGVSVFSILKKLFKQCTYTIMGDISQNIYYDTGMNDWEALSQEVFVKDKDKFYVLAKSYRNTVEISAYATNVLKKCTFRTYEIEPIVRHGEKVRVVKGVNNEKMAEITTAFIKKAAEKGFDTTAIICRTMDDVKKVKELLSPLIQLEEKENESDMVYTNGIMVLPIQITKGLEFDTVVLWNPTEQNYPSNDASAKLLYVAITRALHELMIVSCDPLSGLLD